MISRKFIQDYFAMSGTRSVNDEVPEIYVETLIKLVDSYVESSNMAIIAIDRKNTIVCANQLAARLLKVPVASLVDSYTYDMLPMDSPIRNANIKNYDFLPNTYLMGDRIIWAERSPIRAGNDIIALISYFIDATNESVLSERQRQNQVDETFLQKIFENTYDGIFITDRFGRAVLVNKAYERMSGLTRQELIGENIKKMVEQGKLSTSITEEVVSSKDAVTRNQTLTSGIDVLITGTPLFDEEGEVKHVVTNVRDITELNNLSSKLAAESSRAELYQSQLLSASDDENVICASMSFSNVLNLATKISKMDSTVLLLGETGTGKEIVAQHIHRNSPRKNRPYIKINCGAIPANLLESELFGYVAGAFTGASSKGKPGMFELADSGTLFLDEIGELPINLQSSLLRVLQDGEVTRVGGTKSKKVDVRIITATNRNLEAMISEGTFRSDLFYRLNVVSINIPPLRERIDDIQPLAEKTLKDLSEKYRMEKSLSPNFIEYLKRQPWPGNIRELKNFIEKQFVLTDGKSINSPAPTYAEVPVDSMDVKVNYISDEEELPTYAQAKETMERQLFSRAMEMGGSTYKAAELLKMSQSTFFRKYKELFPDK
ncbi:MAG: sigma 54-interacting transcriptional regulator [Eubacterium sp.]|nr:sigma 54-interacting transcriptional regulator [Candidatus Colimonas fimequi]